MPTIPLYKFNFVADMNPEEREEAIKKYHREKEIDDAMEMLLDSPFMKYFNAMII